MRRSDRVGAKSAECRRRSSKTTGNLISFNQSRWTQTSSTLCLWAISKLNFCVDSANSLLILIGQFVTKQTDKTKHIFTFIDRSFIVEKFKSNSPSHADEFYSNRQIDSIHRHRFCCVLFVFEFSGWKLYYYIKYTFMYFMVY